jgi:predicted dienelactone hydrolase
MKLLPWIAIASFAVACGDTVPAEVVGNADGGLSASPAYSPNPSADPAGGSGLGSGASASASGGRDSGSPSMMDGSSVEPGTPPADGASAGAKDPDLVGPSAVVSVDAKLTPASTGESFGVRGYYPKGATAPLPVVVVAHGYQLDAKVYYVYAERLASYGYFAVVPNFPAAFGDANNMKDVRNLVASLDWALGGKAPVTGDANRVGVMGHSRGGKDVILMAAGDKRVKAVLGLDPVDSRPGGMINCNVKTECPPATDAVAALTVPVLILGETLNATGGLFGMSCAPANVNFQTIYAVAKKPATSVEVVGANHMSFHSDPNCFGACSLCTKATADNKKVLALAQAYTVAFFERHLAGDGNMDAFLTGAMAQQRYVAPGFAKIQSK